MKILIVEDDVRVAELLREALTTEGIEAEIVHAGDEVLPAVETGAFGLLVLDVELPGMDGFDVIAKLRARGVEIPVLMLTGRSTEEDIIRGLNAGANDYVTKPFDVGVLLARVKVLIRRAESARE